MLAPQDFAHLTLARYELHLTVELHVTILEEVPRSVWMLPHRELTFGKLACPRNHTREG